MQRSEIVWLFWKKTFDGHLIPPAELLLALDIRANFNRHVLGLRSGSTTKVTLGQVFGSSERDECGQGADPAPSFGNGNSRFLSIVLSRKVDFDVGKRCLI